MQKTRPARVRSGALLAVCSAVALLVTLIGCSSAPAPSGGSGSSSPSISSLVPLTATAGTAVTITGSGFGSSEATVTGSVTFDGTAATVISWSSAEIIVEVPEGANTGDVVVTSSGKASGGVMFTVSVGSLGACQSNQVAAGTFFNGTYAYEVAGFKGNGVGTHFVRMGSFTIINGNIQAGGDEDYNLVGGGHVHHLINGVGGAPASSFQVGPDFRGCLALGYNDGTSVTFRFSLGTFNGTNGLAERGHIIEFDDGTGTLSRGSGIIVQQNTAAFSPTSLAVNYSFGFGGFNSTGGHVSENGTFTLNPTLMPSTGNISAGYMDANDAGSLTFGATGTAGATTGTLAAEPAGTISVTTGRTTATIVAAPGCVATCTYDFAVYMIDSNSAMAVSTDTVSANTPLVAGRLVSTAASWSATAVANEQAAGLGFLLYGSGSSASIAEAEVGQFIFNSAGTFSSTFFTYSSGAAVGPTTLSGDTFTVTSQGRLTFQSGTAKFVIYLTNPNVADTIGGFVMDNSTTAAIGGAVVVQAAAVVDPTGCLPYSTTSPACVSFGTILMGDATVANESGEVGVVVTGGAGSNDSIGGAADVSSEGGLQTSTFTNLMFTFSATGEIISTTDASGKTIVGWGDGTGVIYIDEAGSAAIVLGQQ